MEKFGHSERFLGVVVCLQMQATCISSEKATAAIIAAVAR
jgi:hypothetical protein